MREKSQGKIERETDGNRNCGEIQIDRNSQKKANMRVLDCVRALKQVEKISCVCVF